MGIPENAPALLILVAFVLPGVVYQPVRSRLRGPLVELAVHPLIERGHRLHPGRR